jgi:exopolysaccharide biosynthesis polyprenyl glycosylphosphotransferase
MKKTELVLSAILLPLDFIMIVFAGLSAYFLRFSDLTREIRPVIFSLPLKEYLQVLLVIALVWIVVFMLSGLYRIKKELKLRNELRKVVLGCSAGLVLIVIYIFFGRDLFSSRFIVLAGWLLSIVYISIGRIIVNFARHWMYRHNIGVKYVVVVGDSRTTDNLIKYFATHKEQGYEVVKHLLDFGPQARAALQEVMLIKEIDEIIQGDPNLTKAEVLSLYDFTDEHHITFKYAADLLDAKVLRVEIDEIAGVPVVEVKKTLLDGWGRVTKRIVDIICSTLLIILTSPIMLITVIAIKLDSKGPIFFSELDDGSKLCRVGQGGKKFEYFKFRSMRPKSDSLRYGELADKNIRGDGPMVKIKDDPRVTKVGKFIRRFSIDELPEFFLVFIGRMSLVGPRPHLPEEVDKYQRHHKKALTIKPGITGLAQVSGRSDLSFEDEVRLDVYYIENWSLWKDLIILFKTPLAVLKSRSAE